MIYNKLQQDIESLINQDKAMIILIFVIQNKRSTQSAKYRSVKCNFQVLFEI